jgi:hypothetical protein
LLIHKDEKAYGEEDSSIFNKPHIHMQDWSELSETCGIVPERTLHKNEIFTMYFCRTILELYVFPCQGIVYIFFAIIAIFLQFSIFSFLFFSFPFFSFLFITTIERKRAKKGQL